MKQGFVAIMGIAVFAQSAYAVDTRLEAVSSVQFDSFQTLLNGKRVVSNRALPGHIPAKVKAMNDLGSLQDEQVIPVMFALGLNDESGLDRQIAEMYREGSPTFHQFLTPEEFAARYAPTEDQVAQEVNFLESNGIAVQSVSENRVFIRAQASVGMLSRTFNTEIHQYLHSDGKFYFAPAYDLQLPESSQIKAVIGLDNVGHLHHHHVYAQKNAAAKAEGTAPGGGVAPADIRKAYGIPASATGSGQTVAVFELDGYTASDIQAYEKQFGLPQTQLQNILVDKANGKVNNADSAVEVTLDIEMIVALAPNAKILVYEGPSADASGAVASFALGYLDVMQKIATDNLAPQISTSWGLAEKEFAASAIQAEGTVYKQMVAQGQTVYAAAGDDGALDQETALSVDNPASQPNVIGVGGTKLTIDTSSNWKSEAVWNGLSSSDGAGGGGISSTWTIPTWQSTAIASDKQASAKMRNVPDVALNSDPATGFGIYDATQQGWLIVGGTSAAAPLWAAFNALVNEQRAANHLSNSGFLAPALYAVGVGAQYATGFNDITSGTNGTGTKSFSAVKGYDNASGWGSFKGGLITLLSAQ